MHFKNSRKGSIIERKKSKACPYHSRVTSFDSSEVTVRSLKEDPEAYSEYAKNNRKNKKEMSVNERKGRSSNKIKLPKINMKQTFKTEEVSVQIDPEYYNYGRRHNYGQNYYEDMKLDNEGWPTKYSKNKISHARHEDVIRKAQMSVKEIYDGEYLNVRNELEIINRIKERYKVLENIHTDKLKYQKMLHSIRHKGQEYQTDLDENDEQF